MPKVKTIPSSNFKRMMEEDDSPVKGAPQKPMLSR
jgi:hypothetical protein